MLPDEIQRALYETKRGSEDSGTSVLPCCRAELLAHEEKFAEARALYKGAIDIRVHALGGNDVPLATFLRSFAELCVSEEKYDEAEQLCERALAIQEDSLSSAHPDLERTHEILTMARERKLVGTQASPGRAC